MKLTKKLVDSLSWCASLGEKHRELTITYKEAGAILYNLEMYRGLLEDMKIRNPNLDVVWMEQFAERQLENLPSKINRNNLSKFPKHLTRKGGLIGATEEYHRERNN